eukprot:TsM_000355900 transcript=TsM_000355900 gene=TsM_000355900
MESGEENEYPMSCNIEEEEDIKFEPENGKVAEHESGEKKESIFVKHDDAKWVGIGFAIGTAVAPAVLSGISSAAVQGIRQPIQAGRNNGETTEDLENLINSVEDDL